MDIKNNTIGIFDSGVGGLTILKAVRDLLPKENLIYLADQAHVPYGKRELKEIRSFSRGIAEYFISNSVKLIVVACNTASAAALFYLRERFPDIPFVGMEPALKPAAEKTETGVVGVLATTVTFQGDLYASVVERFANNVKLLQDPCIGLVEQIEAGNLDGDETKSILEKALYPMIESNIDTVVLGCTHYPLVFPIIKNIVGPNVRLINPALAIARQTERVLYSDGRLNTNEANGETKYLTTGNFDNYVELLNKFEFTGNTYSIKWGKDLNI